MVETKGTKGFSFNMHGDTDGRDLHTVLGEFDLTMEGSCLGIASLDRSKSVNMI